MQGGPDDVTQLGLYLTAGHHRVQHDGERDAATVPTAYSAVLIPASTEARSVLIRRLILLKKFMSSANNKPHRVTSDRSDLWMAEQLVDHPPISIFGCWASWLSAIRAEPRFPTWPSAEMRTESAPQSDPK
jgi:hypothetical protein